MTSARERQEWVEGYEAPIKRALWERITSFGVPRVWATLWMVCCLYIGLLVMVGLGFTWLVVPARGVDARPWRAHGAHTVRYPLGRDGAGATDQAL